MTSPKHIINILTFEHPEVEKIFGFNTVKTNGQVPLFKSEFPYELNAKMGKDLRSINNLYCDFSTTDSCDYLTKVDLSKSIYFAKHYYNYLAFTYFKAIADVIHPNFVQATELWLKDTTPSDEPYQKFFKFTIAVQIALVSKLPELVVSFTGTSKVLIKSRQELMDDNIDDYSGPM